VKKVYIILFILAVLISCTEENKFDFPLIFTGDVTDISANGAVFHAKIVDLSKEKVIEYGFVWNTKTKPVVDNSEKILIYDTPAIGDMSEQISTTLQTGITYYMRAFIRNSRYTTYGKEVTFTSLGSLAPQVIDFIPKSGNLGDTVTITGKNFSYIQSNNKVSFDGIQAIKIKATQDTLLVKVPGNLNSLSSSVSVSILGNKSSGSNPFSLIAPEINDFYDKTGTYRSHVTITGKNFLENPSTLKVYFDKFRATVLDIAEQKITVVVPDSLDKRQCNIKVRMNNLIVYSNDQFQLTPLSLIEFTPKTAVTGSILILTGNNFSIIPGNNIVTIGGLKASVTKASFNSLEVKLPLQDIGYYLSRNSKINIEVSGENHDYNETLLINDKWFRHKDAPLDFIGSFSAVVNNKAYLGINSNKGFWAYDPVKDEFSKLADFPGTPRGAGNGFAIGNKIYFGTGYPPGGNFKDFWEYNILSDHWSQKSDFAGTSRGGATAFSINGTGYLGAGLQTQMHVYNHPFDDFWKYNSLTDIWSRIPSFVGSDSSSGEGMTGALSVVVGNTAYIGMGGNNNAESVVRQRWFAYNSLTNSWARLTNFPKLNQGAMGFNFKGVPYVRTVNSDFYAFNSSTNSWEIVVTNLLPNNIHGIGFSIGNIAYIGIGAALWEYDPSR
jgi:N-acetylneuraminic acid mutarotase